MEFELAYPWLLVLLPAPLLVWWLAPPHRKTISAIRVPFFRMIIDSQSLEASDGSLVISSTVLQMTGAVILWCLLIVGLAKPQVVGEPILRTETARDIMLAIDISGSMDSVDFANAEGQVRDAYGASHSAPTESPWPPRPPTAPCGCGDAAMPSP